MKEDDAIPLNPIISTSSNNDNYNIISEPLINNNIYSNNYNYKNIILKVNKGPYAPTNIINFTLKGKPLEKIEDKTICCSKRRKFPKKIGNLSGYFMTLCFFLFFTFLLTISLNSSKNNPLMTESIKKGYNFMLFIIWITTIISIISLTDAASSDPGRQRGTPIPKIKYDLGKIKKIVGGHKYFLKYCTTCNLIRDIRTFHCDKCGLCIEKHDHHCGYLSNCVGVYNYRKFLIFIIIALIHVSTISFTCIHYIFNFAGKPDVNYEWIMLFVIIILLFGGIFGFFIFWMIVQHIVTIVKNRTTREFIKKKEYKVYDRGCINNCNEALCKTSIKEL